MSSDLYAERIIQLYEMPHNKGVIENATMHAHEDNITCGDSIDVYIKIENGIISEAKFDGKGCAISIASASILTDYMKGKTISDIVGIGAEKLFEIIGINPGPARLHCATLCLRTVISAAKKQSDE